MNFIENEKQFHLGFLPTEQSSPLTKNLDKEFAASSVDGVRCLQRVDRNVLEMAKRIFRSGEFAGLVETGKKTIADGGRIVFSGCGATGRLSILLECMWRDCCFKNESVKQHADQVFSIMTGGDYALVRSVEFFEDYQEFGRQQVREMGMDGNDMLVAITEGGETSSVLGTVDEALRRGSKVFLMFNNPADLLAEHLERSRQAIRNPGVCVLDLHCGPMGLAGSTRMQATTSEQLIAGGALEMIMCGLLKQVPPDYAAAFETLLDELTAKKEKSPISPTISCWISLRIRRNVPLHSCCRRSAKRTIKFLRLRGHSSRIRCARRRKSGKTECTALSAVWSGPRKITGAWERRKRSGGIRRRFAPQSFSSSRSAWSRRRNVAIPAGTPQCL